MSSKALRRGPVRIMFFLTLLASAALLAGTKPATEAADADRLRHYLIPRMVGRLLIAIILVSSLMALVYIWRVIESAYFGAIASDSGELREAPLPLLLGAWIAALANIYFGLSPDVPLDLSQTAADILLGHLR